LARAFIGNLGGICLFIPAQAAFPSEPYEYRFSRAAVPFGQMSNNLSPQRRSGRFISLEFAPPEFG
jgi:hypothetical protein